MLNEASFALHADEQDALKHFRARFHIPSRDNKPLLYFTGNSLGLQPVSVDQYVQEELEAWKKLGVEGHFEGRRPWFHYHKFSKEGLSHLCGSTEDEVVSMNTLTSNLHSLLISFYRPEGERKKILIEKGAFPSDQYLVETQALLHGYDPKDVIVEVEPEQGKHILETQLIENTIAELGDSLALVLFSGVQYLTGQFFDIPRITEAAHEVGAIAGFDLAHAIGNVPLELSAANVDFAAWCSYKYLNSGPGNTGGLYVNQKHGENADLLRLGGWWGHDEDSRFKMQPGFKPMRGADGWQLSNVNVISGAAHLASLELFLEAGIVELRKKSLRLTQYMEMIINEVSEGNIKIITPADPEARGCQLSLVVSGIDGHSLFSFLSSKGVSVDWREPNVIRTAPVPLYNSYMDVFQFGSILKEGLAQLRL